MALLIDKKMACFRLTFMDGDTLVRPVLNTDIVRINQDEHDFAKDFALHFNEKNLEQGDLLNLLIEFPDLAFSEVVVTYIKPARPQNNLPEIELPFRIFYAEIPEKGFIGFEPVMGVTVYGDDLVALKENMVADIGLHFTRTNSGVYLQDILPTQWYKEVTLSLTSVNLTAYTFNELKEIENAKKKKTLARAADEVKPVNNQVFFLDHEIETMERAMFGVYRQSILVTGKSGTGKSALIKAFLNKNRAHLSGGSYFETNATKMINGLMIGGLWFDNLRQVCNELRDNEWVLYIENFSELFEVGQYEGNNQSVAEGLKSYLKRGEITIITECTEAELATIELRSPGYAALFHTVKLTEKPLNQQKEIIYKSVNKISWKRNVSVEIGAVDETLRLQKRFMPYSGFPGKSIRFLEEIIIEQHHNKKNIDESVVLDGFCNETGMPRFMIDQSQELNLEAMEKHFMSHIHGQEAAVKTVTNVLATFKAFLSRTEKPVATLLFIGPTGVGKTEMAKVLAGYVFGSRTQFIRFDMSEFADPFSVLRLTGHGQSSSGLLTDAVRREPFSVVLFDELEKSHYTFYDLLLQILGEGRLTDSRGEEVDFCSTIVIMTSNIGADTFGRGDLGFRKEGQSASAAARHFESEVQKYFRPELFNRIDQIVSFLPLDRVTIRHIVERELKGVRNREGMRNDENNVILKDEVFDFLGEKGYHHRYGARFLQRIIRKQLLVPLSKILNQKKKDKFLEIEISVVDDHLGFEVKKQSPDKGKTYKQSREVQVITLANRITNQRRFAMKIHEGESYVNILSRLAILKVRRKKSKKDGRYYFQNPIEEVEFISLTDLVAKCKALFNDIFRIERHGIRLMFNPENDFQSLVSEFDQWKVRNHGIMLDIFNHDNPGHANMVLGVYGSIEYIHEFLDIYKALAKWRDFQIEAQTVWLHRSRYYYQSGFDLKYQGLLKAQFVGVELGITGKAAYLYFENEPGLHVTEKSGIGEQHYSVFVEKKELKKHKTTKNVYRKSVTDKLKKRRVLTSQICEDEKYLIRVKRDQFIDKLKSYLDKKTLSTLISKITYTDEQD